MPPWWSLVVAAFPPPVTVGPDDIDEAKAVELPTQRVVVFPGRARVERSGTIHAARGVALLRLPRLPGGVDPDSVRFRASGARILSVAGRQVEIDRAQFSDAERVLDRLESNQRERQRWDAKLRVARAHRARLERLSPSPRPAEGDRKGPLLATPPHRWREVSRFFEGLLMRSNRDIRSYEASLAKEEEEARALHQTLDRLEEEGFVDYRYELSVLLLLQRSGAVQLDLTYEVPGPSWSPSYRMVWHPRTSSVRLFMAANIRQSTGEDWVDADILVSTALPARMLEVPELSTWVLGEEEDLVLTPKPDERARPPEEAPWPKPTPSAMERVRAERMDRLAERRQRVGGAARADPRPRKEASLPRRPSRDTSMPTARRLSEDHGVTIESDVVVTGSVKRGRTGPRYQARQLALFEPAEAPMSVQSGLAREAGGADLRYAAMARVAVPSGSEVVSVRLISETLKADTFHRATPSLEPVAFLRAAIENTEPRRWLQGPAELYVEDEFIDRVMVPSTDPSGRLELSLGRDERVEVNRRTVSNLRKGGFLGGKRVQAFDVTLEVVSHLERPTVVEVLEPAPVDTSGGELSIKLERSNPSPEPREGVSMKDGLPADGVLHYVLSLPPKAKREISLSYVIEHDADIKVVEE